MRGGVVLSVLILLSLAVGAYEAVAYSHGHFVGHSFQVVWEFVFVLLIVFWIERDRLRFNIYHPFEFGFLVFLFWIPYLPYYLIRTRRALGVVWLAGFIFLFCCGPLLELIIWNLRY
jgi:hypothetical protein